MLDAYTNKYGSIPEFQPSNLWVLEIPGFPKEFLIKETTLPLYKLSMTKMINESITPGEREGFSSFTVTIYDTPKFIGFNFFYNWLLKIYDFDKKVWKKTFHSAKVDASLKFLRFTHNMSVKDFNAENRATVEELKTFTLHNLMVIGIGDVSLTNDNTEPLTFEITCDVENIIPQ